MFTFFIYLFISSRVRSHVIGPLVEKSLGSSRAGTRQKALEALLFFIEMDKADPVIEDMLPYLTHRTPKLVAGTVHALTEILKQYGSPTVSCKPIFKSLPALFSHADKNVRAETQLLTIELYKWLGAVVKDTLFPDLKPVQQKDLEAEFEKITEKPTPLRLLRSQQAAKAAAGGGGGGGESASGAADDAEDDGDVEMDLFDPVEVLSKIPPDFSTRVASTKWKERKEALEELHTIVNVPKLQTDDYGDIIRILAKCMKDANLMVVTVAANCVECIAKGLRKDFAKYQPIILTPMLEKLKEKKASVATALANALDAVFNDTSLTDILKDTLEFFKHKTPQIKIESAKFMCRCLQNTKVIPPQPEIKAIVDASIQLLSDTQEPVRTEGAHVLGVVMKLIGERAMNPYLESVEELRKGKIKEFYESAQVKAKPAKAAAPPPSTRAQPAPTSARSGAPPGARNPATARPVLKSVLGRKRPSPATPAKGKAENDMDVNHMSSPSRSRPLLGKPSTSGDSSPRPPPLKRPGLMMSPRERAAANNDSNTAGMSGLSLKSNLGGSSMAGKGLTSRPLKPQLKSGSLSQPPAPQMMALTSAEKEELTKLREEVLKVKFEREMMQSQIAEQNEAFVRKENVYKRRIEELEKRVSFFLLLLMNFEQLLTLFFKL